MREIRIRQFTIILTAAEVSVIQDMIGIATAGPPEGDYGPWTKRDWAALKTLEDKLP